MTEEKKILSNEELEAIEAKAGVECRRFVAKDNRWEIVVRGPTDKEWEFYMDRREQKAYKQGALRELLSKIVVYPTIPEFLALCKRFPGIPYSEAINDGISEMMGMIAEEVGKG